MPMRQDRSTAEMLEAWGPSEALSKGRVGQGGGICWVVVACLFYLHTQPVAITAGPMMTW